ncbi:MAG: MaoC family dehydratase [Porticoccaceae bacterium]|nr:MaoC family dehydratase [Gammaproteobacteria bacterium]MBK9426782.1 MaoC family dehydratase [Gammaproteobacteria bacterium]TAL11163.1 MAG: MaoC family dehydratase [Porticoccaceae bacterium]
MTIRIDTANLAACIGQDAGTSEWFTIDQQRVNDFADVTLDHQFIHVDPVRAAQGPFGTTIAHGFLTLSMLAYFLQNGVGVDVPNRTMGVNYGFDKVRFLQPVKVGSRIRAKAAVLEAAEKNPGQFLFKLDITVEIEGQDKPAIKAEWLSMIFTR